MLNIVLMISQVYATAFDVKLLSFYSSALNSIDHTT